MFIAGSATTVNMHVFAANASDVTGVVVSLIIIAIVLGITSVVIAIILLWRRKVKSEL